MAKRSAGILLWKRAPGGAIEVLLVHPGGPFWMKKDAGAWSIPKGLVNDGEDELAAARREFFEETGHEVTGEAVPLGEITQAGAKIVVAWAVEGAFDPANLRSNTFQLEWPPKSGKMAEFPEVDRAEWFGLDEAREKILHTQAKFFQRLLSELAQPSPELFSDAQVHERS